MNKDESAFPILETEVGIMLHPGLTKREYFAGLAMQGFMAKDERNRFHSERVAKEAVAHADALLKELESFINN